MRAIPNYIIITSTIIGVFESIFSRYFFGRNELYIGSLFILFTMVCVFIKYSSIQYPHFLLALEGCSTYVYIFHLIISSVITAAYSYFGANTQSSLILFKNIRPILVCIVSTIFAFCITQLIKKIQHKKWVFIGEHHISQKWSEITLMFPCAYLSHYVLPRRIGRKVSMLSVTGCGCPADTSA